MDPVKPTQTTRESATILDITLRDGSYFIDFQDTIDVTSGPAQFHSGFLGRVQKSADSHEIDVRRMILTFAS